MKVLKLLEVLKILIILKALKFLLQTKVSVGFGPMCVRPPPTRESIQLRLYMIVLFMNGDPGETLLPINLSNISHPHLHFQDCQNSTLPRLSRVLSFESCSQCSKIFVTYIDSKLFEVLRIPSLNSCGALH